MTMNRLEEFAFRQHLVAMRSGTLTTQDRSVSSSRMEALGNGTRSKGECVQQQQSNGSSLRQDSLEACTSLLQHEVQRCEDLLKRADTYLQADIRRVETGHQPWHMAETDECLWEAEQLVQNLYQEAHVLTERQHPHSECLKARIASLRGELQVLQEHRARLQPHNGTRSPMKTREAILHTGQRFKGKGRQRVAGESETMQFITELLVWVERSEVHIENIRWGDSKATVESQFQSHTDLHNMIEAIGERVEEAKLLEASVPQSYRRKYQEALQALISKYSSLMDISTSYMKDVSKLDDFIGRATAELIWLNQHEEREIAYDWSDRSLPNLAAKKDSHSELLKEMERKEITINRIQGLGNQMLQNNHPAVDTIEGFMGALQTQWSWLLQLRQCIEVHLQENTTYQQFFSDAKEAELFLKRQHEVIRQKYTCDKHASLEHVEQLLQNLADERDSYMNYRQTVANVAGRAKSVVQLKPRHPDHPVHGALPIKALCEYKLDEMMIAPGDQCILMDNSRRVTWRVIGPGGREVAPLSLCFIIPPINKDALEMANRIDHLYEGILTLWCQVTISLKCLLYWRYMLRDMGKIYSWSVQKMPSHDEYCRLIASLESHYENFVKFSQDAQMFDINDINQIKVEFGQALKYASDVDPQTCVSQMTQRQTVPVLVTEPTITLPPPPPPAPLRDIVPEVQLLLQHLQRIEETVGQLSSTPLPGYNLSREVDDKMSQYQNVCSEAEVARSRLERLYQYPPDSLGYSELSSASQRLEQLMRLLEKCHQQLKGLEGLVRCLGEVESQVELFEGRLVESVCVPVSHPGIQSHVTLLKQWVSEVEQKGWLLQRLQEELQKAGDLLGGGGGCGRPSKQGSHRSGQELGRHVRRAEELTQRWHMLHEQMGVRLRDMERLGARLLPTFQDRQRSLSRWLDDASARNDRLQLPAAASDAASLDERIRQQTALVSDLERNKAKVDELHTFSEDCIKSIKEYEGHLAAYRNVVQKFQNKHLEMQHECMADTIEKEYKDIFNRYNELLNASAQQLLVTRRKINETDQEFFLKAKEAEIFLKEMLDSLRRKYGCDKCMSFSRLEVLVREAEGEAEKIARERHSVDSLQKQSKTPKHQDAVDRIERLYQQIQEAWRQVELNLQSLLAWHQLQKAVATISGWTLPTIQTLRKEELDGAIQNLDSQYNTFVSKSHGSEIILPDDCAQSEGDVRGCKQHYHMLLTRLTQVCREEELCHDSLSRLREFMRLADGFREQILQRVRAPLEHNAAQDISTRIFEQERLDCEVRSLRDTALRVGAACVEEHAQPSSCPLLPGLEADLVEASRHLDLIVSLSSDCRDDLKCLEVLVKGCQEAEEVVGTLESELLKSDVVPADRDEADRMRSCLQQRQSEVATAKESAFARLERELQAAREVNERLARHHGERDANVERCREHVEQLLERWRSVRHHLDGRVGQLAELGQLLHSYAQSSGSLTRWLDDASRRHEALQGALHGDDGHDLKNLILDIQSKQQTMDECQKICEQCCSDLKDYEVLLLTYRTLVEKFQPNFYRRNKISSPSDRITQDYINLRTRYNELLATTNQALQFEFLAEAHELEEGLKSVQETLRRAATEKPGSLARLDQLLLDMAVVHQRLQETKPRVGLLPGRAKSKDQQEKAHRLQQLHAELLVQWERQSAGLQGHQVIQRLQDDICTVTSWNEHSLKLVPEHEQSRVMASLEKHLAEFTAAAQAGGWVGVGERFKVEKDAETARQHYQALLGKLRRESEEEQRLQELVRQLSRNRQKMEDFERLIVQKIHVPVTRCSENAQRISELQRVHQDVEGLRASLEDVRSPGLGGPASLAPELGAASQRLHQILNLSSHATSEVQALHVALQDAESLEPRLAEQEHKLAEESVAPGDVPSILKALDRLKDMEHRMHQEKEGFTRLEGHVREARAANDELMHACGQRDPNPDAVRERADDFQRRWAAMRAQIDSRRQSLEQMRGILQAFRGSHEELNRWLDENSIWQEKIQHMKPDNCQVINDTIEQLKKLLPKIEENELKLNKCKELSELFAATLKDHEVLLMSFRRVAGGQDLQGRREKPTNDIIKQYVDIYTRFTSLKTTIYEYLKFLNGIILPLRADEFLKEAGEIETSLRSRKEAIGRKYACDRTASAGRLESLLEDCKEEQRNVPDRELQRRFNALAERAKVPAEHEAVSRIKLLFAEIPKQLQETLGSLQGALAWQRVRKDITVIQAWNLDSFKKMSSQEREERMSGLRGHHEEFRRAGQRAGSVGVPEWTSVQADVEACERRYRELQERLRLESEQNAMCKKTVGSLQSMGTRMDTCRERISLVIRKIFHSNPAVENAQRIREIQDLRREAEQAKVDYQRMKQECLAVMAAAHQVEGRSSMNELLQVNQRKVDEACGLAAVATDVFQKIDFVVKNTERAESQVKDYEKRLCEEELRTCDANGIKTQINHIKHLERQAAENQWAFQELERQVEAARSSNDKMHAAHGERDGNLERYGGRADDMVKRWRQVRAHGTECLKPLESTLQSISNYEQSNGSLRRWYDGVMAQLEQLKSIKGDDDHELKMAIARLEKLVEEIEKNNRSLGDCQKYAEQVTEALKAYETILRKYRVLLTKDYGYNLPPQKNLVYDGLLKEYVELQSRLKDLSGVIHDLQGKLQAKLTFRVHHILRKVLVMVDGIEMPLMDAFDQGHISKEKFAELVSWQGEKQELELISEGCQIYSADGINYQATAF
ncbi:unnamed protein product [Lampetra planeri]